MNLKRRKQVLLSVSLALAASGIGIVVWAALVPDDGIRQLASRPELPRRRTQEQQQESIPSLAEFQEVWDKPLRRALVDLPPTIAEPEAIQPNVGAQSVRLVGIIVEGDHFTAMFSLPDGAIELKEEGEVVQGSTVVSIKKWGVTLQLEDQIHELRLQENELDEAPPETVQANE